MNGERAGTRRVVCALLAIALGAAVPASAGGGLGPVADEDPEGLCVVIDLNEPDVWVYWKCSGSEDGIVVPDDILPGS